MKIVDGFPTENDGAVCTPEYWENVAEILDADEDTRLVIMRRDKYDEMTVALKDLRRAVANMKIADKLRNTENARDYDFGDIFGDFMKGMKK